jgi:hypothetical protein
MDNYEFKLIIPIMETTMQEGKGSRKQVWHAFVMLIGISMRCWL